MSRKAIVLGAREGTGNIGDEIVKALDSTEYPSWKGIGNDCAIGDGSRPPGGNLPDDATAEAAGYNVTEKGRYQRFDVPSAQWFTALDADALVVTLGATYKDPFWETEAWDIDKILRANLALPLEGARRFVRAKEADRRLYEGEGMAPGEEHETAFIIFVGSYAHDHPFTNGTLYCAAKAGLNMAARALAWELTGRDYRVHVVNPYHVQGTPMWAQVEKDVMASKDMTWEEADAYNRKDLKMPDLLTAREVAEVVGTLLTVPALQWTSGSGIDLYGGSR